MKIIYKTDDGKTFNCKESAEAHENELKKSDSAKEELVKKITDLDKKLYEIEDQIDKLVNEHESLTHQQEKNLIEYKNKYATKEQRELYDRVDKFLSIFGD